MTSLAPTLEAYFTDRLIRQRRGSPHTIASYRDTFRLLLAYIHRTTGTPPSRLQITDLDGGKSATSDVVTRSRERLAPCAV